MIRDIHELAHGLVESFYRPGDLPRAMEKDPAILRRIDAAGQRLFATEIPDGEQLEALAEFVAAWREACRLAER